MGRESQILHEAGLKATELRIRVLHVLLDARQPLAHREVVEQAGRRGLDRVSVYRALQAFVAKGIAHRVLGEDRVGRFALCDRKTAHPVHPHFVCRSCGKIVCLKKVRMPPVTREKLGHRIEEQFWTMRGVCSACLGAC
ncbi:MAG: transcriptional repressor [bacterium]